MIELVLNPGLGSSYSIKLRKRCLRPSLRSRTKTTQRWGCSLLRRLLRCNKKSMKIHKTNGKQKVKINNIKTSNRTLRRGNETLLLSLTEATMFSWRCLVIIPQTLHLSRASDNRIRPPVNFLLLVEREDDPYTRGDRYTVNSSIVTCPHLHP